MGCRRDCVQQGERPTAPPHHADLQNVEKGRSVGRDHHFPDPSPWTGAGLLGIRPHSQSLSVHSVARAAARGLSSPRPLFPDERAEGGPREGHAEVIVLQRSKRATVFLNKGSLEFNRLRYYHPYNHSMKGFGFPGQASSAGSGGSKPPPTYRADTSQQKGQLISVLKKSEQLWNDDRVE